ncbi:MAG: hypothetical protein KAU22_00500, partial [Desulfuromonadales bacterium]|nr:hypothetical protein [Desulfuromonadales bacterium]
TSLVMSDRATGFKPVDNAKVHLQTILELYWQGLKEPLRFFPETSMAYGKKLEWQLDKALKMWEGDDYSPGDKKDPHYELCFGAISPVDEQFEHISRLLLEPLIQHQR